ncbi:hypothetical protein BM1_08201 [Bipolaris maydis]|nr:hypothetical protein BM1_08201 [Bipolaris maydis]
MASIKEAESTDPCTDREPPSAAYACILTLHSKPFANHVATQIIRARLNDERTNTGRPNSSLDCWKQTHDRVHSWDYTDTQVN